MRKITTQPKKWSGHSIKGMKMRKAGPLPDDVTVDPGTPQTVDLNCPVANAR